MEMNETETKLRTDTESIKLYKNTKGYNWEIKILGIDIKRLEAINEEMKDSFGNGTGE